MWSKTVLQFPWHALLDCIFLLTAQVVFKKTGWQGSLHIITKKASLSWSVNPTILVWHGVMLIPLCMWDWTKHRSMISGYHKMQLVVLLKLKVGKRQFISIHSKKTNPSFAVYSKRYTTITWALTVSGQRWAYHWPRDFLYGWSGQRDWRLDKCRILGVPSPPG